jgi:hypothetical protein
MITGFILDRYDDRYNIEIQCIILSTIQQTREGTYMHSIKEGNSDLKRLPGALDGQTRRLLPW